MQLFSVQWTSDTVDNEHLGKKSSKCCCIYKKKKKWDEDSDSDDSVSALGISFYIMNLFRIVKLGIVVGM